MDMDIDVKNVKRLILLNKAQSKKEIQHIGVSMVSLLLILIEWSLLKAPNALAAVLQNLEDYTTNGVWITTM